MICSSLHISVPGGWLACGLMSSGLSKLERTKIGMLCTMPSSTERTCKTLAPWEASSSMSSNTILEPARFWNHSRVGRIDAVHVGIDIATVGLDRGCDRHRRGVGAATPERRDPVGLRINPLEAGDDGNFLAFLESGDQFSAVDIENPRRSMRVAGLDRDLPALPGTRLDADGLQRDRKQ